MRSLGPATGAATVLVVGVSPHAMGMLREYLGTEAILPSEPTSYQDGVIAGNRLRPQVVIFGFDRDPEEAVRLGPILTSELPGVHLVALSERSDPDRIRAAMRAGYREYVVLPDDVDLLRQAVHEAAYAVPDDEERGEVIAVCGTKGGMGVTSLSINLAAELTPVWRVCVVDLDFSMGDVAALLDLKTPSHIGEVLRKVDRLDERMLAGSVGHHGSKIHVLAQPDELDEGDEVRGDAILALLTTAARSYQYVLLDCGSRIDEATLMATSVADRVLLVCGTDVPSVKNAHRRMQLFDRLGVERERIYLVVNQYDKRKAHLSLTDIQGNLGVPVSGTVSDDPRTVDQAVNDGRLVRDVNKRSPAALDYSNLVGLLTEGEVSAPEPAKAGLMGWLLN